MLYIVVSMLIVGIACAAILRSVPLPLEVALRVGASRESRRARPFAAIAAVDPYR